MAHPDTKIEYTFRCGFCDATEVASASVPEFWVTPHWEAPPGWMELGRRWVCPVHAVTLDGQEIKVA